VLVRYDLMILWRSGRAAFSTKSDILLLLLGVPAGLLAAQAGVQRAAPAVGALPLGVKLLLAAGVAFAVNIAVGRRLAHLREESVIARQALRAGPALLHAFCWNIAPFTAVTAALLLAPRDGQLLLGPLLLGSYLGGVALAAAQAAIRARLVRWRNRSLAAAGGGRRLCFRGASRGARIRELIAARCGFPMRFAASLLLFAGLGAAIGFGGLGLAGPLAQPVAAVLAGLLILVLLALLLRQHPPLLRYLLYLGSDPAGPAVLIPAAMAGALVGGFLLAGGAAGAGVAMAIGGAAALLLLFILLALLRTLHYATRSRQAAEIAIQLDLVALFIVGWAAPPLAAAALPVRLGLLWRRARRLRYLAA
jgi:hypothetical protein